MKIKILLISLFVLVTTLLFASVESVALKVKGLTWPGKAYEARSVVKKLDGVSKVKVDMHKKIIILNYDNEKTNLNAIKNALGKAGFEVIK